MADYRTDTTTCPLPVVVYSARMANTNETKLSPKEVKKENLVFISFVRHLKDQYWTYVALLGILFVYAGIVLFVFGFTSIFISSGPELGGLGIFLTLVGIALIMTSGILYHRKVRRLRPCICCGIDMDDEREVPIRTKRRLRFAPNLISPYYQSAKEKEIAQRLKEDQLKHSACTEDTVVMETEDTVVLETEEHLTEPYDGSCTSLITKDKAHSPMSTC